MNVSYEWLRAIAPDLEASPQEVADRLALQGAPVDEIVPLGAGLDDIVVARVVAVREHPNADRLRLCDVDAGAETIQVVCGAPNVEAGATYPFAPVGASLPDGTKIRKAKIRGETSQGMLCSERELGLGRDHGGLMRLAGEPRPGAPFLETTGLADTRLVVDVTPNRPDLLSHVGIAREVAPRGVASLSLPAFEGGRHVQLERVEARESAEAAGVKVTIEDAEGCWRYLGAVVRGVTVGPSPAWLAARLRAAGLRPINNVVDATNYVLLELGQPLHAFDLDRLAGPEIRVRASSGESIRTLDGADRKLPDGTLVIADARRPVAIAGVMGGEESEVCVDATKNVLLECALFDPKRVRSGRRALGMSTDASFRFERGVDPSTMETALRRALELIVATAGGTIEPVAADVAPAVPVAPTIDVRPERVSRVLGIDLEPSRIADLLAPLGFEPVADEDLVRVGVPAWRLYDVTREIDVIEEVARRYGYDRFPDESRPYRATTVPDDAVARVEDALRTLLVERGMLEARGVAFAPAGEAHVELLKPLSAEEAGLRAAVLPGLLRRVEHNWAHGRGDVRLFELGTVFRAPADGEVLPPERRRLAVVMTGRVRPPHFTGEPERYSVWDVRGLMEDLAGVLGGAGATVEPAGETPETRLGPERLVARRADGTVIGWGGRVDDARLDAPAWVDAPVWACEFEVAEPPRRDVGYRPIPTLPAVERDLALAVPTDVAAATVERVIRSHGGELVEAVWPFDHYTGSGIAEGTRGIGFRVRFRAADRTLRDEEVDALMERIVAALEEEARVRRR